MYRIRKSIDIDFSHHVRGHQGSCINLHGHTWKFELEVQAQELDAEGFVIDFGQLKRQVLRPCHQLLDHALAVGEDTFAEIEPGLAQIGAQLLASRARPEPPPAMIELGQARQVLAGGMKVALFPFSPTSERLARWLHDVASAALNDGRARVHRARIYETLHPVEALAEYFAD